MNGCPFGGDCDRCQAADGPVVCHCLGVTEDELVAALTNHGLRTVRDVRRHTGAGTGCNGCHRRIEVYIQSYSSSSAEICSAR